MRRAGAQRRRWVRRSPDRDRCRELELLRYGHRRREARLLTLAKSPPRIAVVGAGIGGLAAANQLMLLSEERGLPLEIVVLEAAGRVGGLLGTEAFEGALLERGPDTLVTHKPAGIALCERLGLGDRLTYPPAGRVDILYRGRLVPVPDGFALLAPSRRGPLLRSPLLGWRGKLRALRESTIPPAATDDGEDRDESVASFVRRRFGDQLLQRVAEPIVGAIYMADVEQLSLAATFPRFFAMEREHGSVTRALRSIAISRRTVGPPPPAAATLTGGLGQIVEALVARLPNDSVRLNTRVERLLCDPQGFSLHLEGGNLLTAAAVLLATPAHGARSLLRDLDAALAESLGEIHYASCVTVSLGWPRCAVERPPQSHGFFVPVTAGLDLVATGFVNVKFPERVSKDQVVARVFLGGALRPDVTGRCDAHLVNLASRSLVPLLGLREPPAWSRIHRHLRSMPQPRVGHLAQAASLRARLGEYPGLEFAGGPLGAYGLPDSIAAGESAARRLFDGLEATGKRG